MKAYWTFTGLWSLPTRVCTADMLWIFPLTDTSCSGATFSKLAIGKIVELSVFWWWNWIYLVGVMVVFFQWLCLLCHTCHWFCNLTSFQESFGFAVVWVKVAFVGKTFSFLDVLNWRTNLKGTLEIANFPWLFDRRCIVYVAVNIFILLYFVLGAVKVKEKC